MLGGRLLKKLFALPKTDGNAWETVLLCLFSFLGALMLFGTQVMLQGHR